MEAQAEIARLFCMGIAGPEPDGHARRLLRLGVRSFCLFGRNVETPRQLRRLCDELKRLAGEPVLIGIDQEGGRVARLSSGFTALPSARQVGRHGDEADAHALGRLIGRELRAVNIDWDFAPVLDVDTNPANPVIADRSFASDPATVARVGAAVIRGMQFAGVAACGKHFPGHGDTLLDSHHHRPVIDHPLSRLEAVELPPFAAAAAAGVATIMTAHVVVRAVDASRAATMSRPVIEGLLRRGLRFDGLVVSDDLGMKAVAARHGLEQIVIESALAGVDLMAMADGAEAQLEAIDLLNRAVERGDVPESRVVDAGRRFDSVCARFARPPSASEDFATLDCDEHRAVVARIAAGADAARGADPTRFTGAG